MMKAVHPCVVAAAILLLPTAAFAQRSHAEYRLGKSVEEMIRENLVAERIAIDSYREMAAYVGEDDPTTKNMLEQILAVLDRQIEPLGQDLGCFASALPRARIERLDLLGPEAIGDCSDFCTAHRGKPDARCAPCQHSTLQGMLTMPQKMKHRHFAPTPIYLNPALSP